jgi:4-amino-4-deoxy-L-arabinose transferase-like glycosyltransferase
MRENRRIRRAQILRSGKTLAIFVIVNLLLRLALLPLNEAEYTDGILQLTQFANQTGIYPPLYTALTWPLAFVIGPLWAGRLVSVIFSALAVIPLFLLAKRSFGARAALFASLIYTVAPVSLRWAPRVMTESVFCFFFWFACERLITARATRSESEMESALMWSGVLGALAALTRYQGVFLAPPVLVLGWFLYRRTGKVPWKGLLGLLPYGLIPLWSAATNTIHGGQLAERMGDIPFMTFLLNAEPFVLLFPYFLTYPVAILVTMGLCKGRPRPRASLFPLTVYVFAVLLVLQSLFGSFQERYFLPLFGLFYIYGGLGMAVLDHILRRRQPWMRPYIPITVVAWSAFVAFFVLFGGRQAFGDLRHGAEFAASTVKESGGRIFTNEIYRGERQASGKTVVLIPGMLNANLGVSASDQVVANKVEFFARTNVFFLDFEYYEGRLPLRSGDLLVMSDTYGAELQVPALAKQYHLVPLQDFQSRIYPIFPDIMSTPGTAQNPAAFLYRYSPQDFRTVVYRVDGAYKR